MQPMPWLNLKPLDCHSLAFLYGKQSADLIKHCYVMDTKDKEF